MNSTTKLSSRNIHVVLFYILVIRQLKILVQIMRKEGLYNLTVKMALEVGVEERNRETPTKRW